MKFDPHSLILAAAVLLAALPAHGELLLYEPFDYTAGEIAGSGDSELGFDGGSSWTENSSKTTEVQDASLGFGTLATLGGEFHYNVVTGTDLNRNASRDMSVTVPTGEIYIAYLMKGPNGGRLNGGVYINGTEALQEFGALRSQYNTANTNGDFPPHVYYAGERSFGPENLVNGLTYMYVQRFTGLGSESGGTAQLWVIDAANYDAITADEVVTAEELDLNNVRTTPVLTLSGAAPTLDGSENLRLHFHDNGSGNTDYVLDEIRIATSFEEAMGVGFIVTPPTPAPVGHYWDFTPANGVDTPQDLYGGLVTTEPNGFADLATDSFFGEAFAGATDSLNMALGDGVNPSTYLKAETYGGSGPSALNFGTGSFAVSYWAFDHSDAGTNPAGDGDPRGARIFDCLAGESTGMSISTDPNGSLVVRIDDDADNSIVSSAITGFETVAMPANQWVHVSINVDRDANLLTIYFNGTAITEGSIDISSLTGSVFCTQDLEIGVIDGGGTAATAQKCGIDDLAFYPGLLSTQQITELSAATTTPVVVLDSFQPEPPIPVISVSYASGEVTVVFTSANGKTYSVFGGTELSDIATWPEISVAPIIGDGTNLPFSHSPSGPPARFFMQVRED